MPVISASRRLRPRAPASFVALVIPLATSLSSPAFARAEPPSSIVYVETNATAAGGNAVLGYRIADDGKLHELAGSPFLSKGTGFFDPSYGLGPFDNDPEPHRQPGRQGALRSQCRLEHDRGLSYRAGRQPVRAATLTLCGAGPYADLARHPRQHADRRRQRGEPVGTLRHAAAPVGVPRSCRTGRCGRRRMPPRCCRSDTSPARRSPPTRPTSSSLRAFPVAARSDRTCSFRSFPTCFPPPTWRPQ